VLLPLPAPYDFVLSTERYRRFGVDLANLWDEDALLRAVGGREIRIRAAPGGVDVAVQTSDWTPKPATTMPGRWVDNTSSYKAPVFDEQTSPKTGAAGSQQP